MGKRLHFAKRSDGNGSGSIRVMDKEDNIIGWIDYYEKWKRFVFSTTEEMIWSWGCLQEVVDYMKNELKSN